MLQRLKVRSWGSGASKLEARRSPEPPSNACYQTKLNRTQKRNAEVKGVSLGSAWEITIGGRTIFSERLDTQARKITNQKHSTDFDPGRVKHIEKSRIKPSLRTRLYRDAVGQNGLD